MNPVNAIKEVQGKNKSMLCVGLDLDQKRLPSEYATAIKGWYDFATAIIDATKDIVCAYKPNLAFFEERGPEGISLLEKIIQKIPDDIVVIADGKRGDIGNTAAHYAKAMFERMNADWVTINPYMGYDSIRPFLDHKGKGAFILCLTSNPGSRDFQLMHVVNKPIYMYVAEKVAYWNKEDNLGLVVGATHPEQLADIRRVAGDMPILIPGVGAQGGDLEKAVTYGTDNFKHPAIINVSRSVLYASSGSDFADAARAEVQKLNSIINSLREKDNKENQTE
ncbi:MAG: orotidine-5'-phosphate decarboxylase [Candidatus Zixiibacteriota bacterium]|nr:MAG: orotidine-5'-phosphate decarboxylase [candidate division Zixibacteria bacterium]HDL03415.1 orotidine-5'-phosphate decarboxylase [candidate division Zixibacteria bacterium]